MVPHPFLANRYYFSVIKTVRIVRIHGVYGEQGREKIAHRRCRNRCCEMLLKAYADFRPLYE